MRIESEFTVDAPPERAWAELLDAEDLVSCLPGASLRRLGHEDVFQGPVELAANGSAVALRGTVRPIDADDDERSASFRILGHQAEGPGIGKGILEGRVAAANGSTRVALSADLEISGQTAKPDALEAEAQRVLEQFAERLGTRVRERRDEAPPRAERAAPPPEAAPESAAAPVAEPANALRKLGPALVALALVAAVLALLAGRRPKGFSVAVRYRA